MRPRIVLVGILWAIGICVSTVWAREWGDASGKYKIEATFVEYKEGNVRLKKPDGSVVSVSLSKLRKEDQNFVLVQMMLSAKQSEAEPETKKAEPAPASQPAEAPAAAASDAEAMFEVVKTEIAEKPVEVNSCRVTPKAGSVLYVCTINFTKAGMALSHEALGKLKISKVSIKLSKNSKLGNIISKGDFALRLDSETLVPCYCLPAADTASGLPVRPPRVRSGDNWLMYCGNVRLLASVKPEAKPQALVWGATYEAKIPAPGTAKQPATPAHRASPLSPSYHRAAAQGSARAANTAAAADTSRTARAERNARREAVLKNGVLSELAKKHPELASVNIAPQLVEMDEILERQGRVQSGGI